MSDQSFVEDYGPWALVTGASSGIGAEFARQLAAQGFNIVMVARREALLNELAAEIGTRNNVKTQVETVDLGQDGAAEHLDRAVAGLDIGLVVSNAGTGMPGRFLEQDHGEQLERVRLNALSHFSIGHLFGQRLAKRVRSGLILSGAMGAAHGIPFMATDAGAKAFLQSFGESLHLELKAQGIQVMTLVVPPTDTDVIAKFNLDPSEMPMKPMSAKQCASEALAHFRKGRSISLPGRTNRIMSTLIPDSVARVMMGKMIQRTLLR